MITEDYVSFETAKLLKEKGFDEACFRYAESKKIYDDGDWMVANVTGSAVGVPTLQMAMKWLREVHNIHLSIVCDDINHAEFVFYRIERIFRTGKEHRWFSYYPSDDDKTGGAYPTYEEACENAIKYCLENLI